MKKSSVLLIVCALLFASCSEKYTEYLKALEQPAITAHELKVIQEMNIRVYIIDMRPKNLYEQSHIPDAISLDETELERLVGRLPFDAPIIVYTHNGIEEKNAIERLKYYGFNNVKFLIGGYTQWIYGQDTTR